MNRYCFTVKSTNSNLFCMIPHESFHFFDAMMQKEKPAIAMDRGIATKENLDYLKQNGYSYFIIERRDVTKLYKEEFSDIQEAGTEHITKSKQKVYLKRIDEDNCTKCGKCVDICRFDCISQIL